MNDSDQISTIDEKPGELALVDWVDFVSKEAFDFENGGTIPGFTLRYETYGRLNEQKDNAILICHALSGDHHAAGVYNLKDRKPGWWNNMIGPGKPFDTNRFFIIASNCLGGCQGSTGPGSINPATEKPFNLDFPVLSILDMVRAQKRLVESLGIEKLYAVAGGSMGGMQVLQWMIEYPDMLDRALPMATTARQSAQTIAFNEVGRSAIVQDRDWNGGSYEADAGPNVGLAVARMMAHITYLSEEGMEDKFGRTRRMPESGGAKGLFEVEFEVESYLRYQGASFVNRFDANTYLYFTKALDRFDLYQNGKLEDAFKDVKAKTLVVGFTSDWLFPPQQNREIVHALLRSGKVATYAEVSMSLGHDSFLVDAPELDALVRAFISQ